MQQLNKILSKYIGSHIEEVYVRNYNTYSYKCIDKDVLKRLNIFSPFIIPKLINVLDKHFRSYVRKHRKFMFNINELMEYIEDCNPTDITNIELIIIICFLYGSNEFDNINYTINDFIKYLEPKIIKNINIIFTIPDSNSNSNITKI